VGLHLSQLADELRTVHTGHDVVGNDDADLAGEFVVLELFESAHWIERCDDEVSGPPQDGLAGRSLDGVVVDQKDRGRYFQIQLLILRSHGIYRSACIKSAPFMG
jgi:hypothetical protein